MKLQITYKELAKLLKKESGIDVEISRADELDRVRVKHTFNIGLFDPSIALDIKVEDISGMLMTVSYHGSKPICRIVNWYLGRAARKQRIQRFMIEPSKNIVIFNLGTIPKIKAVLTEVALTTINVREHDIVLNGKVRTDDVLDDTVPDEPGFSQDYKVHIKNKQED